MERDMNLVINILKRLELSHGNVAPWKGPGYSYIVTEEYKRTWVAQHKGSVLLPLDLCRDFTTMKYHADMMEQAGLIERGAGPYSSYPMYRLTWDGHDFIATVAQEGVIEKVEDVHGKAWTSWTLDVLQAVVTEVVKQTALRPFST